MNKKFLKSLAILGLASTALGVAQPVGAVVKDYKRAVEEYDNILKNPENGKAPMMGLQRAEELAPNIIKKLDLMRYLITKEEFIDFEYSAITEKLENIVAGIDTFLNTRKLSIIEENEIKRIREEDRIEKTYIYKLSKITLNQYNKMRELLDIQLRETAKEIINVQSKNNNLISYPVYSEIVNNDISEFKSIITNGYYDMFYTDYLRFYLSPVRNEINSKSTETKKKYFDKIKEIVKISDEIKKIISDGENEKSEELSLKFNMILDQNKKSTDVSPYEVSDVKESVIDNVYFIENCLIFAEEIPNLKIAEEKLKNLQYILNEYKDIPNDDRSIYEDQIKVEEERNRINQARNISKKSRMEI